LEARKKMKILMMERDRLLRVLRNLDENREAGRVTKVDYDILHERYEDKLQKVEDELGLGEQEKPDKRGKLKFWGRKRDKKAEK
jgi:hypothetical protein